MSTDYEIEPPASEMYYETEEAREAAIEAEIQSDPVNVKAYLDIEETDQTDIPFDVLPKAVSDYALETLNVLDCKPELVFVPTLPILAAVAGNDHLHSVTPDWTVRPCLRTIIIADSGGMKSVPLRKLQIPLDEIEEGLHHANEEALREHKRKQSIHKRDSRLFNTGKLNAPPDEPEKFIPVSFLEHCGTGEGFKNALKANRKGLILFKQELSGWVDAMDAYRKGNDKELWIHTYDGDDLHNNLAGTGKSYIKGPLIGIVGCIQPETFEQCFGGRLRVDGNLQRFMICQLEMDLEPKRLRRHSISEVSRQAYVDCVKAAYYSDPCKWVSSQSACDMFDDWQFHHMSKAKADVNAGLGSTLLKSCYQKSKEWPLRLVPALGLSDFAGSGIGTSGGQVVVSEELMHRAIIIADWMWSKTRDYLIKTTKKTNVQQRLELVRWIKNRGGEISHRDLYRNGPKKYRTQSCAEKALRELAEHGMGQCFLTEPGSSGGRQSDRFRLNF